MTTDTDTDLQLSIPNAPAIPGLRFRRPRGDEAEYQALAGLMSATSAADGPTASIRPRTSSSARSTAG